MYTWSLNAISTSPKECFDKTYSIKATTIAFIALILVYIFMLSAIILPHIEVLGEEFWVLLKSLK